METTQLLQNMANPQIGINAIVQNNPDAVAQRAIDLGLTATSLPPESLIQAISDLLRNGDIEAVKLMLSVPFNPNSGNATDQYSVLFAPYKGAKSADGSGVDWWTVAGSALIGGLTGLMNQNAAAPGSPQNPNVPGAPQQNPPAESNTVLIVVAVVFGLAVVTAIGYFLIKAAK